MVLLALRAWALTRRQWQGPYLKHFGNSSSGKTAIVGYVLVHHARHAFRGKMDACDTANSFLHFLRICTILVLSFGPNWKTCRQPIIVGVYSISTDHQARARTSYPPSSRAPSAAADRSTQRCGTGAVLSSSASFLQSHKAKADGRGS
jgi:hypothetical protein